MTFITIPVMKMQTILKKYLSLLHIGADKGSPEPYKLKILGDPETFAMSWLFLLLLQRLVLQETNSVAMGFPLSPVTMNFFTNKSRDKTIKQQAITLLGLTFEQHFCDLALQTQEAEGLAWPAKQHQWEIHFIMETERYRHLPFLDDVIKSIR